MIHYEKDAAIERELEIVKTERDELNKLYEELIIEKTELSKSYTQIGENLSYHIKQEDMWRQKYEILEANPPYSIEYVNSLKNQVTGLEEKVADLEREIKEYYS